MHNIEESLPNKTLCVNRDKSIVFYFYFEQIWMNAVGTSITAIRSPAAQIIVVHLLALVIKATLATALSACSITQVWSDIKLKHCTYSKRRASAKLVLVQVSRFLLRSRSHVFNGHQAVASTAYMQRLNFRVSFYDFPNSNSKQHAMEKSSCAGGMVSSSFLQGLKFAV